MGLFDKLRNRPSVPSTERRLAREQPGPMTAHESWAIAHPEVKKLDEAAKLTLVTSGLDIDHAGRSFTWEFMFVVPRLRATALVTLAPADDAEDVDRAPIHMTLRLSAAAESELTRAGLPVAFRDSPDVVAELAAQGVDFVAGPTDLKLESRQLRSEEAVWVTYYGDAEILVSFSNRTS
jgi:hypothetical protein